LLQSGVDRSSIHRRVLSYRGPCTSNTLGATRTLYKGGDETTAFKAMTWNVENLFRPQQDATEEEKQRYQDKLGLLAGVIGNLSPDVVALQEVGGDGALADLQGALNGTYPHREVSAFSDGRGIRVAFLSRHAVEEREGRPASTCRALSAALLQVSRQGRVEPVRAFAASQYVSAGVRTGALGEPAKPGRPVSRLGELRQESRSRESRDRVPKKLPGAPRRTAIRTVFRVALQVRNRSFEKPNECHLRRIGPA
jgi:hypothetical protein